MSDETQDSFDLPPETGYTAGVNDDDDAMTQDEFDKLVSGVTHPAGDYTLMVTDIQDLAPTTEKPTGGTTVKFAVKAAPAGAVPKGGSWEGLQVTFRRFLPATATDKNKISERIDKQDMAALVKGLGLSGPGPDGKIRLKAALIAGGKGRLITAAVEHDQYNGRTQQRTKNFRPIAG